MAVDQFESTTGRPIFLDSGAPDVAVDPTAVGIYAAEVGNRIVKANLTALNSYTYRRAGLMGHALDTKTDYIHNGTGWIKVWITAGALSNAGTNGSGVVTVTHGLGKSPVSVSATIATTSPVIASRLKAQAGNFTATTFDVLILRNDQGDAPFTGNPVHFYWTAVA